MQRGHADGGRLIRDLVPPHKFAARAQADRFVAADNVAANSALNVDGRFGHEY